MKSSSSQSQKCGEKGPQPSSPTSLTPLEMELLEALERAAGQMHRAAEEAWIIAERHRRAAAKAEGRE